MRIVGCTVLLAGLAVSSVRADDAAMVTKRVQDTVDALKAVFETKDLTRDAKRERVMKIIAPVFDYQVMAMLSLGKTNWQRLSEDERKQFVDLFVKQLEYAYFDKAEQFCNEDLKLERPVAVKTKYYVITRVAGKGESLSVKYKLYKSDGNWVVYDVEVEGVSLISSYRSQYAQIMKEGSGADLLAAMRKKMDELKSE